MRAAMTKEHPGASSYTDQHGRERWRFRRRGMVRQLPGDPAERPEYEAAYTAALTGKPQPKATIHALPGAAHPRSLRSAWRLVTDKSPDWKALEPSSRAQQTGVAERFLSAPVTEGERLRWGDLPIADLKRRHIKEILSRWSDRPHAAEHILRLIRKLTGAALDEEWIEVDPAYRLKYRPEIGGFKAWPMAARAAFEARWPLGSNPRTAYALALYHGHRRSDLSRIRWTDLEADAPDIIQYKTGNPVWIPMIAPLREALEAVQRRGDTVLVTAYGEAYSDKGLSGQMQVWASRAGLEPGHTLHGLRKTLGKMLAEGGASANQIKAILGHSTLEQAELYTREAERRLLAIGGMAKLEFKS